MCGYLGELSLRPFDRENLFESNLSQVCRGPDETKYLEKVIGQKNYNLSLVFNILIKVYEPVLFLFSNYQKNLLKLH